MIQVKQAAIYITTSCHKTCFMLCKARVQRTETENWERLRRVIWSVKRTCLTSLENIHLNTFKKKENCPSIFLPPLCYLENSQIKYKALHVHLKGDDHTFYTCHKRLVHEKQSASQTLGFFTLFWQLQCYVRILYASTRPQTHLLPVPWFWQRKGNLFHPKLTFCTFIFRASMKVSVTMSELHVKHASYVSYLAKRTDTMRENARPGPWIANTAKFPSTSEI